MERLITKIASLVVLCELAMGAVGFCQSPPPLSLKEAGKALEIVVNNSETCCVCSYDGEPNCERDVRYNQILRRWEYKKDPNIPGDCVYYPADQKYVNRFKKNCEKFKFEKWCTKTIKRDVYESKPTLEEILKANHCGQYYEWVYRHGSPALCPVYFNRLYCIAKQGISGKIELLSCNVFEDISLLRAEIEKLREKLEDQCYDGQLIIEGANHLQMINQIGLDVCDDKPTAVDGEYNVPFTLKITAGACKGVYEPCDKVINKKKCPSPDSRQYAYCSKDEIVEGEKRKVTITLQCKKVFDQLGRTSHAVWVPLNSSS